MRFPFRVGWNSTASYVGLLAASFALALFISYILGPQINDYAYDSMYRAYRPPSRCRPESVVLAIDELTLMQCGGIRGIRRPIAQALRLLAPGKPKVVAIDVILADQGDPADDAALAAAFHATPNLVLSTELIDGDRIWEDPRPEFAGGARLGHVSAVIGQGRRHPLDPALPAQCAGAAAGARAGSVSAQPRRGHAARIARLYALARRAGERGDCRWAT